MMKWLTDSEVMDRMNQKYDDAKRSSKEGVGTGRGLGSAGLVGKQWIMWRNEAVKRGLV